MAHAVPAAMTDDRSREERLKAANRKTALTLFAIVVLFFFGIIVSRIVAGPVGSVAVMGTAVLVFLIVAIARLLKK
jgi:small neutral amino acid transporter SnatA (MarC family)